jgi:hypothetical protein
MNLTTIQDLDIQALIGNLVGAEEFERLLRGGAQFIEVEEDILLVAARSEEVDDETEEKYWQELASIAARILERPVGLVMVLPKLTA